MNFGIRRYKCFKTVATEKKRNQQNASLNQKLETGELTDFPKFQFVWDWTLQLLRTKLS